MQAWITRIGVVALCIAAWSLVGSPPNVMSQSEWNRSGGERVQLIGAMLPGGFQQIVVLDQDQQSMAVYHVEPSQGRIHLKSVRRLVWDLKMEQFNAETPLPSELRVVQPGAAALQP